MSLPLLAAAQATGLEAAATLLRTGRAAEAADAAGAIVAELDRRNAGETRRIYYASGSAETLLYVLAVAKDKVGAGAEMCDALFLQAHGLVERKRVAGALPLLNRAMAMAPSNAHHPNEQAYVPQSPRRWPEALAAFARGRCGLTGRAPPADRGADAGLARSRFRAGGAGQAGRGGSDLASMPGRRSERRQGEGRHAAYPGPARGGAARLTPPGFSRPRVPAPAPHRP